MSRWQWLLAVVAALVLGAALIWWHDGTWPRLSPHNAINHNRRATQKTDGPMLYRWVDVRGVVNITDHPPKSRHFTIVHINPEQNIVPADVPAESASRQ